MRPNLIVKTLLESPTIMAIIGDRKAQAQLPQGCQYPAVVYDIITVTPRPVMNYTSSEMADARVQIEAIAKTMQAVDELLEAIRLVFDLRVAEIIAGKMVVDIRRDTHSPLMSRDAETGMWSSHVDYTILYYE